MNYCLYRPHEFKLIFDKSTIIHIYTCIDQFVYSTGNDVTVVCKITNPCITAGGSASNIYFPKGSIPIKRLKAKVEAKA